jgi:hypothetical protein
MGLEWLVAARNEIQTLMWELQERWDSLGPLETRQFAAGAVFSLWRAVFLLAKKEELLMDEPEGTPRGRVSRAAKAFIGRIVRTNTITFADEMSGAHWTAGYYVNNALYRVSEMQGVRGRTRYGSSILTLRQGWNDAFRVLKYFIETGTLPGTSTSDTTGGKSDAPQSGL